MLAIVDGDIIIYRIGFTTEDLDSSLAYVRARETLDKILIDVGASGYKVFLTEENDPNAFRRKVYPEYKANRTKPKPKWYQELRAFLQVEYDAEVCTEIEADDAMAITQMNTEDSIICSIDKDLKQIPGGHYNFVKQEFDEINVVDGLKNFYTQLLTGDSSDNIKGVWKIGLKKAEQILAGAYDEQEMFNRVRTTYSNDEEMLMNGRVIYIWRKPNDDWLHHWNRLK